MDKKKRNNIQLDLLKTQSVQIQKISKSTNLDTIKAIEDEILMESVDVVKGCLGFADISFDDQTGDPIIPEEWESLPQREQDKKIRLAKFALMSSNEIPHGVKMAHQTMIGIIKARATQDSGTKVLNIENATFPSPSPLAKDLEIIDVDDG